MRHDAAVLEEPTDFCRLWLLRHPELDASHQEQVVGDGLGEVGHRGLSQVRQWLDVLKPLPFSQVWSGDQPQCQTPAQALAQARGLTNQVDARLRDQHMGRWQGRLWREVMQEEESAVRAFFGEFGEARAPGGESLGDAMERALQWWSEHRAKLLGAQVLLVLPGALVSGFCVAMLGLRMSRAVGFQLGHGGIGALDLFDNGGRLACWNVTALNHG